MALNLQSAKYVVEKVDTQLPNSARKPSWNAVSVVTSVLDQIQSDLFFIYNNGFIVSISLHCIHILVTSQFCSHAGGKAQWSVTLFGQSIHHFPPIYLKYFSTIGLYGPQRTSSRDPLTFPPLWSMSKYSTSKTNEPLISLSASKMVNIRISINFIGQVCIPISYKECSYRNR